MNKPAKEFFVETRGYSRISCEWIRAATKKEAEAKAAQRHGISIKVKEERTR